MPNSTFDNLPEDKRRRFMEEALLEFASHPFEQASINRIVKRLGIARGSVYQYFNDKTDLWLYLKRYAEERKLHYIQSVRRENFDSFWDYYRALYKNGIAFDRNEPLCSRLLYTIGFKENSPEVRPYLDEWKTRAETMMRQWIDAEKARGGFSKDIDTPIIAHFMTAMSMGIAELLKSRYGVDFDDNLARGKPLFADNQTELEAAVEQLITLLQKALQP